MYQGKTHIHIENSNGSPPVFNATEQQVQALLDKNPDLAGELHITIGCSDRDEAENWSAINLEEYYAQMKTTDIFVGYMFPLENIRGYAPDLKVIHFISSGVDHVAPFTWVPEGVQLVNNRGVHLPKSGESFGMFLAMLNAGIPRLVTSQHNKKWDRHFTSISQGKTLVVIGVGNQGGEMARRAKGLGMYVIGISPFDENPEFFDEVLPNSRMKEAFGRADMVALTAPLTDDTRNMMNRETMDWLPKHAGIINVSRGALIDEKALHDKLVAGELSGAILDVFSKEPLPQDHFLWETPNLIMTPHVSSDDLVNYIPRTLDLMIQNLRNEREGKPLINLLDLSRQF
ncbi:D-2-hydroxyacid dehydrogenase [Ruminococcaceae bacterium OttesenSCG-928-D13]|nr:D-2-hydroxyacid dehydrogenase [Ruminococcaceae bacterium OttesenSCG-928-D13]